MNKWKEPQEMKQNYWNHIKQMRNIFFFLLLFPILANGQMLSLEDAIRAGLENTLNIKIAAKDVQMAENSDDWAVAGRTGNIDLNLNGQSAYSNSQNPFSTTESINLNLTPSVQASMLLYGGHRVRLTKEQLNQAVAVSKGNLNLELQTTARAVTDAYLAALLVREQLSVLEQVKELSRDRVRYEEVKREFGQSGRFDFLTAQDAFLTDSITYRTQVTAYTNSLEELKFAMQSPGDIGELSEILAIQEEEWTEDALVTRLIDGNQSLQNQALAKELSRINLDLQRAQSRPVIQLDANINYNSQTFPWGSQQVLSNPANDLGGQTLSSNGATFGFTATYNLVDGGVRKRNIENARIEAEIADLQEDQTRELIINQLKQLYYLYNSQLELAEIAEQSENIAAENLTIAETRFRSGQINSFDFRNVQLAYANAAFSKIDAVYRVAVSQNEIRTLIGAYIPSPN